jgi:hypothetical protein
MSFHLIYFVLHFVIILPCSIHVSTIDQAAAQLTSKIMTKCSNLKWFHLGLLYITGTIESIHDE